ncbi:hypothetical protein NDU88_007225, partial [Pleurodeles waltl]
TRNPWAQTKF